MVAKKAGSISIVVPLLNECENVSELIDSIVAVMGEVSVKYELIMVDDGSTDDTIEVLQRLGQTEPHLKIIQLRRNFGQTAAISAGFDHAQGEVIITLDGDLQNDPTDIPRLLAKLEEGYDVVSGWRRSRKDPLITRKIPSQAANFIIGKLTGVKLHDYGCTFKAYRREVVEHINLYGEMHRFIPAIASWSGARVTEIEVNHHPRRRGTSKYGLNRTVKVLLDLVTVKFLGSFSTKPLHIFGSMGLVALMLSILSSVVMLYQKFFSSSPLSMNRNPLLTMTAMLLMMSVQFLLMGLLAEMMCRTYHESQKKPTYVIRRIIGSNENKSSSCPSEEDSNHG